ncbi:unnamed protein product [Cylicocyclus nassatus]|uniref:Uncharacterized protein n=1 Tax=Cylicocyclus nassatus TaxID=53992 RepID=A0AA36MF62_CYLNA|nr:unnamed protein product [Cylicocyclus nassatus]
MQIGTLASYLNHYNNMPRPCIAVFLLLAFAYSLAIKHTDRKLLTCMKCLGNDTACRNTCTGYYCYKFEMKGQAQHPIKRGCLNDTDALSRVNECTLRENSIGGLVVVENVCICTSDMCNSSTKGFYSSLMYMFLAILLPTYA